MHGNDSNTFQGAVIAVAVRELQAETILWQVEALKRRPGVRVVSIKREDRDRKMREVLAALQTALRCKT